MKFVDDDDDDDETELYFDNFCHTHTSINFPLQAYFIFFIKLTAENQLRFQQ